MTYTVYSGVNPKDIYNASKNITDIRSSKECAQMLKFWAQFLPYLHVEIVSYDEQLNKTVHFKGLAKDFNPLHLTKPTCENIKQ